MKMMKSVRANLSDAARFFVISSFFSASAFLLPANLRENPRGPRVANVNDSVVTFAGLECLAEGDKVGFTHAGKMIPVKSHDDFSRPLVEKGEFCVIEQEQIFSACELTSATRMSHPRVDSTWSDCSVAEQRFWADAG